MSNLAKYRAGSGDDSDWIERELAAAKLPDARLEKRLQQLVAQLSAGLGRSIPFACQDWAETKAAYRFFSNERIREEQILAGHFEATRERLPDGDGPVLVLHDTTEFTYQRQDVDAVGMVSKGSVRKDEQGRPVYFTTCGVCLHSSLAVTLEGLPLGLTAARFWSRKAFKGRQARRKAHNAPIEEKESMRWLENLRASSGLLGQPGRIVHVADQESDIFDLFCVARQLETHFLVRTRADRLADGGPASVAEAVAQSPCRGLYRIEVRNRKSEPSPALLEIRYRRLRIKTPKGKQKRYPEQTVTAIEAREQETPPDRERIDWKLVTDLPVGSVDEAIEKLQWYALRWKIGVSSQGHMNQPVQVRPRPTDSSLVAGEAPRRESKTVKPSDNMLRKEYVQLTRLQRAVNADVASLHANPEAETVDNARKQQGPTETSPMRRLSPAGYQRRHGGKVDVSTGEALGIRRRNLAEEMTAITLSGKCRHRCQGGGSGRTTVDGRAAKRARREGPGPVSNPLGKVRQG